MTFENIKYVKEDGLAIITLNVPERLNALSSGLLNDMSRALEDIMADGNVRAVIITGGPRVDGRPCFCAGADLKNLALMKPEERVMFHHLINDVNNNIEDLPKATIAAIDGICTAGGFELAVSADLRTAATTAEIRDLHVKNMGGMGGAGLPTRLPRLVGIPKALELCWTGDIVDGEEAVRIGLVNRCYPPDKLMDETKKLARKIASMRPIAVEAHKAVMHMGANLNRYEALHFSERWHDKLGAAEGRAQNFLDKKKSSS